ncbi:MAG: hypothetical protein AMXMBFR64_28640 [Myxococcales bacterium]
MTGLSVLQMDQRRRDRHIGTVIGGRWLIRSRLGGGGEGAVYLAAALTDDAPVAVKVRFGPPVPETEAGGLPADPLAREHAILGAIAGPHFPRAVELGHLADDEPYLVREFIDGPTLHEVIRTEAPMALPRAMMVLRRLCDAALALHAAGYWHRDIKPANVILCGPLADAASLRLLDYGSSWPVGAPTPDDASLVQLPSGTAAYMAPEVAAGGTVGGEAADLYAIAAVAYELLTGKHILGKAVDSPTAAHEYVLGRGPIPRTPIAPLRPDLPSELAFGIERALSRDPMDRGSSVAELRKLLGPVPHSAWEDTWDPRHRVAAPLSRWEQLLARLRKLWRGSGPAR